MLVWSPKRAGEAHWGGITIAAASIWITYYGSGSAALMIDHVVLSITPADRILAINHLVITPVYTDYRTYDHLSWHFYMFFWGEHFYLHDGQTVLVILNSFPRATNIFSCVICIFFDSFIYQIKLPTTRVIPNKCVSHHYGRPYSTSYRNRWPLVITKIVRGS